MYVHTSHRASLVIRPELVEYGLGGSHQGSRVGNTPIGTYDGTMSEGREEGSSGLHPISSLCQDIDDELLMLWLPSSHIWVRING